MSSLRFSCSVCARTLPFNRSNKQSIRFKSRLFAGHLSCCMLFATSISIVLLTAWHDAIPRLTRLWRRTDPMTSFLYLITVMFPWIVTLESFRVNEKAWVRSVMLIFAILNVFHNRPSTRNTFLSNSPTTLPCTSSPST